MGHLDNEKDATVAVTGCPDVERNVEQKLFITLMSKQSPNQKSFAINLSQNKERLASRSLNVVKRQLPEAQQAVEEMETTITDKEIIEEDQIKDKDLEARVSKSPEIGVSCSIRARIKMGTDASSRDYIQNRFNQGRVFDII